MTSEDGQSPFEPIRLNYLLFALASFYYKRETKSADEALTLLLTPITNPICRTSPSRTKLPQNVPTSPVPKWALLRRICERVLEFILLPTRSLVQHFARSYFFPHRPQAPPRPRECHKGTSRQLNPTPCFHFCHPSTTSCKNGPTTKSTINPSVVPSLPFCMKLSRGRASSQRSRVSFQR